MSLSVPFPGGGNSTLRSLVSPAFAIALALFAGIVLAYVNILWDPGYYGDFGFSYRYDTVNVVGDVVAGSPADKAGLKPGDIVVPPRRLSERLTLGALSPRPGERVRLSTLRNGRIRTATIQARPLAPLPVSDKILLAVNCFWLLIFIAAALALVLLRPSRMTWGFYLFALNLIVVFGPPASILLYAPVWWTIAARIAGNVLAPAGVAGFVIFCVRFPANTSRGWRKTVEDLATYAAAITAVALLYAEAHDILFVPFDAVARYYPSVAFLAMWIAASFALRPQYVRAGGPERRNIRWIFAIFVLAALHEISDLLLKKIDDWWSVFALFALGGVAFAITYVDARGIEKYKVKWVAFGFSCVLLATAVDFYVAQLGNMIGGASLSSIWYAYISNLLYLALPITVAYAIIRHRVTDIRFAASRTLTLGIIASVIILTFLGIDWVFSTRLPSSHLEAAIYAGLALLIGFSLNAGGQRIGKVIDFVFFRQWYRAQEEANAIADTIGHAASKVELYEPLTAGIAQAFSLASTALFERIEDGGFVRVGSCGWPAGMAWHIFPNDPLAVRAAKTRRVLNIDAFTWNETALPSGIACPTLMFPVVSAKRVVAILMCGAHESGAALAYDEIRIIRRSCADVGVMFGKADRPLVTSLAATGHGK